MAKLTNRQMEILAERVVDILEEQHKEKASKIRSTEEYLNFEQSYYDDNIQRIAIFEKNIEDFVKLKKKLIAEADELNKLPIYVNTYNLDQNKDRELIKEYVQGMKDKTFEVEPFDRYKMLRKIQADILLSDVGNPEELVNSMVNKFNK